MKRPNALANALRNSGSTIAASPEAPEPVALPPAALPRAPGPVAAGDKGHHGTLP